MKLDGRGQEGIHDGTVQLQGGVHKLLAQPLDRGLKVRLNQVSLDDGAVHRPARAIQASTLFIYCSSQCMKQLLHSS